MKFTWDTRKERANIRNHGVNFTTAGKVFDDPNYIEKLDASNYDSDEVRYDIIGYVNSLLFVVYTERENDTIRIISARRATATEEKLYARNLH